MSLVGKIALVTGADSEVSEAIARRFSVEGARVVLARHAPSEPGRALGDMPVELKVVEADLCSVEQATRVVAEIDRRLGQIDILVNFGAMRRVVGTVVDVTDADFQEEMHTDLRSVMVLSAAAIPLMTRGGGGAILNIASIAAAGLKARALRSASKAALAALTRAMAQDHGEAGIRVNALLLGPTTGGAPTVNRQAAGIPERGSPLGYDATPTDVAAAAHFLVSEEARSITGALVPVDAGRSLPTF
jgi:meso-butanediol dehydrogenase / (S,S)-butanediol dehydrogenase / diacetyl reductase